MYPCQIVCSREELAGTVHALEDVSKWNVFAFQMKRQDQLQLTAKPQCPHNLQRSSTLYTRPTMFEPKVVLQVNNWQSKTLKTQIWRFENHYPWTSIFSQIIRKKKKKKTWCGFILSPSISPPQNPVMSICLKLIISVMCNKSHMILSHRVLIYRN